MQIKFIGYIMNLIFVRLKLKYLTMYEIKKEEKKIEAE